MNQKVVAAPYVLLVALLFIMTLMSSSLVGLAVPHGKWPYEVGIIVGIVALVYVAGVVVMVWFGKSMYEFGKQDGENGARLAAYAESRQEPSWFAKHHCYDYRPGSQS